MCAITCAKSTHHRADRTILRRAICSDRAQICLCKAISHRQHRPSSTRPWHHTMHRFRIGPARTCGSCACCPCARILACAHARTLNAIAVTVCVQASMQSNNTGSRTRCRRRRRLSWSVAFRSGTIAARPGRQREKYHRKLLTGCLDLSGSRTHSRRHPSNARARGRTQRRLGTMSTGLKIAVCYNAQ